MKIMYLITTLGHGRGGHFYDLSVISSAVQTKADVFIVNIGLSESPIINDTNLKVYNIYFNGINVIGVLRKLLKIVKLEAASVIHAFDLHSFSLGRIISHLRCIPVVLSKCGGPNPKDYYPYSDYLIVMSQENFSFFDSRNKQGNVIVKCFPNRSSSIKDDKIAISYIREIANGDPVLIRISRITDHYKSTLIQSVNLANELYSQSIACKLFIIGVVQSKSLFKELKNRSAHNPNVIFLTDNNFTINASKVLSAADFVIGTGRGIMEAASKGKVLLTPVVNSKYPSLISSSNFYDFYKTNFSPRNSSTEYNEKENFDAIKELILSEDKRKEYVNFSKDIYIKEFDIFTIIDDYFDLYKNARYERSFKFGNFLRNFLPTIINIYKQKR